MSDAYLKRLIRGPLTRDVRESSDAVGMSLRRAMVSKLVRQFAEIPPDAEVTQKVLSGLQWAWQDQVMRLATLSDNKDHPQWYRIANCRPVGYTQAGQPARRCSLWRVCPWCYVRQRLVLVCGHMLKSAFEPDKNTILVATKTTTDIQSDPCDLFCRPDRMTAAFSSARMTMQVVGLDASDTESSQEPDSFFWRHSMFGVLPKTPIEKISRRLLQQRGYAVAANDPNTLPAWIGRAMDELLHFPSRQLYAEKNLDVFRTLFFTRAHARLVRVSRFCKTEKSKRERTRRNGCDLPAIPDADGECSTGL
jgi:hypothetical protein